MPNSAPGRADRVLGLAASGCLGLLLFALVCGPTVADPRNVGWLYHGDPLTHWLGWHFFRSTPFFQWPLGLNAGYGEGLGSTIVMSDSLPLFALLFRPFSALLSPLFQYTGIWIALCFVLQSILSFQVLRLFRIPTIAALVASAFFVVAPPFLLRINGHYALAGQWIVLLSFFLYFSSRFRPWSWVLVATIAALVHAYLLAMALALWAGDLLKRLFSKELSALEAARSFAVMLVVVTAVTSAAGYFAYPPAPEGGFGLYRLDLFSPFNPAGFSRSIPEILGGPYTYEGMNFFGIGMLLLIAGAACVLVLRPGLVANTATTWLTLLLCVALTMLAASNQVAIGSVELFSVSLPSWAHPLTSAFRSSGRLFWPVYYMIMIGSVVVLVRALGPRRGTALLAFALALQLYDSWPAYARIHASYRTAEPKPSAVLSAPIWSDIARRYRRLAVVLPGNQQPGWNVLGYFAAENGLGINTGYFARANDEALRTQRYALLQKVLGNGYADDTVYVFQNDLLWSIAQDQRPGASYRLYEVDGFRLLLPGAEPCTGCRTLTEATTAAVPSDGRYAGAAPLFVDWSYDEGTLRWSAGARNHLFLLLDPRLRDRRVCLTLQYKTLDPQTVTVEVAGGTRSVFQASGDGEAVVDLGPVGRFADLAFSYSSPRPSSPTDARIVAFAIKRFSAEECPRP